MDNRQKEIDNLKDYKYGFSTEIENTRAPKGLNEDVNITEDVVVDELGRHEGKGAHRARILRSVVSAFRLAETKVRDFDAALRLVEQAVCAARARQREGAVSADSRRGNAQQETTHSQPSDRGVRRP